MSDTLDHRLDRTRAELADFLRRRREGLSPLDVGLPVGKRRRTPGLRREEVAALAGVGLTWYTCFTPSVTRSDHVHFIDGAGGGYASAALALKAMPDRAVA